MIITEEKDKYFLIGIQNGSLQILMDDSDVPQPQRFEENKALTFAKEKAKELGPGYSCVVFEAAHMEVPEVISRRVHFRRSSTSGIKKEVDSDEQTT